MRPIKNATNFETYLLDAGECLREVARRLSTQIRAELLHVLSAGFDEGQNGSLGQWLQATNVLPQTVKALVVARTSLAEVL